MLRKYFLDTLLLSLFMSIVLIIGVIASSILFVLLSSSGIPRSNVLPIALATLFILLILGIILLPRSYLRSIKNIYLQVDIMAEQTNTGGMFKLTAIKLVIFSLVVASILGVIWIITAFGKTLVVSITISVLIALAFVLGLTGLIIIGMIVTLWFYTHDLLKFDTHKSRPMTIFYHLVERLLNRKA